MLQVSRVKFCYFYSEADEARKIRQEERKRLNMTGSEDSGCLGANGWSLPPKSHAAADSGVNRASIPIPVYCRPVTEAPSVQVTSVCILTVFI